MGGAEGRRGIHLRRNNKFVSLATSPRHHIGRIGPWGSSRSSPPLLSWMGSERKGRRLEEGESSQARMCSEHAAADGQNHSRIHCLVPGCSGGRKRRTLRRSRGGRGLAWSLPCVGVDPRWSITLQSRNKAQEQSNLDCGWSGGGDESSILRRFSRKRRRSWRSVMPESRPPRSSR